MYLPQFHEIRENNEWWGEGYTEWTAVKKAKPIYDGHNQPRIPMNNNYYDLSDESGAVWKWQAEIAKSYGVYGFCIYHYWFKTGEQLLEKPMEILLNHPEIDLNYCICWANESWARNWYGLKDEILKKQEYGDKEEWISHFNYLLPFFKDVRYIKINNKPVVNIYRSVDIKKLPEMLNTWNELAEKNGFAGIYLISARTVFKNDERSSLFDAYYNFEPGFTFRHKMKKTRQIRYVARKKAIQIYNCVNKEKKLLGYLPSKWVYAENIKHEIVNGKKCYLGTFPRWDNTPRRQYKGRVYESSPRLFYENLLAIKNKLHDLDRDDDFVYINAWNEWGEGAYLEPDNKEGYAYLDQIKRINDIEI